MRRLKISQKAKIYLRALGLLGFLAVLGMGVARIARSQIPSQKNKLAVQLKKEQALSQKSELLRALETDVANQADLTSFALPPQNSSFIALSQLKKLAQNDLVIITNLRIGAEAKDGNISSSDISFDAEGPLPSVLTLLENIGKIAPIAQVDKVQINQAGVSARATVRIKVYWAALPTSLPAISEPLGDLTSEEKEVLLKVLGLTPPEFVLLAPEEPRQNTNPF